MIALIHAIDSGSFAGFLRAIANAGFSKLIPMRNVTSTLVCTFAATCASAQSSYSPYSGADYPSTVYWGDTHLHTSRSADAYYFGDRLEPETAYRLARGETVVANNGMHVRLRRPLDFLVIADHAESIGVFPAIVDEDPLLGSTDTGAHLISEFKDSGPTARRHSKMIDVMSSILSKIWSRPHPPELGPAFESSVWRRVTKDADANNIPGRFTAFIGYEWTSGLNTGINLHRVVIFKDDATKANQVLPFSAFQSENPEDLWTYMAEYEKRTGGEILAIPHNGNLSAGKMFSVEDFHGHSLSREHAGRRSRWEPLYEVTQIKGSSEAHPILSPSDEFADYEIWNSWYGKTLPKGRVWNDEERALKGGEYARSALKRGLWFEENLGVNPFKFGMIGSTDAHNSLSAVEENNFWGKFPENNPGPRRATSNELTWSMPSAAMAASGYAAIWATENTREALFAAMKRREVYATTGSRITVRFFGGWEFAKEDALRSDLALIGYRKGVPMGGDLKIGPTGKAASFLVHAVKDPDGANLDRIQVIKGWLDGVGETHETIYNVALSDDRIEGEGGRAARITPTVNIVDASYLNSVGDPELAVVWSDPSFDPRQHAFYYVRVLEIPTPRWTAYDAKYFGLKDIPPEIPMITQERAYTSPIWYTPRHEVTGSPE